MGIVYQLIQITLAAGETRDQAIFGSYLRILSSSIATNPKVRIASGSDQEIQPGMGIKLDGAQTFGKCSFTNPSATDPMVLRYAVGDGYIDDSSLTLAGNSVLSEMLAQMQGSTSPIGWGLVTVAATATAIMVANAARKSAVITALAANTGVIYLGYNNTVSAVKYFIALNAGDSFSIDDYLGDIYGLAAVAGEKVSVSEV